MSDDENGKSTEDHEQLSNQPDHEPEDLTLSHESPLRKLAQKHGLTRPDETSDEPSDATSPTAIPQASPSGAPKAGIIDDKQAPGTDSTTQAASPKPRYSGQKYQVPVELESDELPFNLRSNPSIPIQSPENKTNTGENNNNRQSGGGGNGGGSHSDTDANSGPMGKMLEEAEEEPAGWLITYADMVTLLLAFFVLLFSVSTADLSRFQDVMESVQLALAGKPEKGFISNKQDLQEVDLKPAQIPKEIKKEQAEEEKLLKDISDYINKEELESQLNAFLLGQKIIIRLTDQLVFNSGSAKLNPEAIPIFDAIIEVTYQYPDFDINIKGHTDNVPIETVQFPSNWELSAIRATTVLRYFVDKGINPLRLTATGYGSILPIQSNQTTYGRSINRRVEFVLQKHSGETDTPITIDALPSNKDNDY